MVKPVGGNIGSYVLVQNLRCSVLLHHELPGAGVNGIKDAWQSPGPMVHMSKGRLIWIWHSYHSVAPQGTVTDRPEPLRRAALFLRWNWHSLL